MVEIALDTWDHEEIKPFWRAVLGMQDHPSYDQELRDLSGSQPTLWFQETDRHDEPRQRFHLDIRVPPEVAAARIAAALEAGGVLVSDEQRTGVHRPGGRAGQQGLRDHRPRARVTGARC